MELLGKIKLIGDIKTYGDNGFRKRELVLTTEEQYPQHILIEFIQNNCELLDNYSIGPVSYTHLTLPTILLV